jgi:hypothetical protein
VEFSRRMRTQQHANSKECIHYAKSKKNRKQELIPEASKNDKFLVGEQEISRTSTFKYLGRVTNDLDDILPAVENQLRKARQVWARISRVIRKKD